VARWASLDPFEFADSVNRYLAFSNSPSVFVDQTGHSVERSINWINPFVLLNQQGEFAIGYNTGPQNLQNGSPDYRFKWKFISPKKNVPNGGTQFWLLATHALHGIVADTCEDYNDVAHVCDVVLLTDLSAYAMRLKLGKSILAFADTQDLLPLRMTYALLVDVVTVEIGFDDGKIPLPRPGESIPPTNAAEVARLHQPRFKRSFSYEYEFIDGKKYCKCLNRVDPLAECCFEDVNETLRTPRFRARNKDATRYGE
jgi:hypothetical protein